MPNSFSRISALTLAFLFTCGCGRSALDKVVVSGAVTYRGEPVGNGEIMFYPTGSTQGPMSGASIKDGRYVAQGKGGVPVGTHRVVVRAFRAGGGQSAAAANAGIEGGVREQYLPKQFNEQSTLEATIDGNESEVIKDFDLNG